MKKTEQQQWERFPAVIGAIAWRFAEEFYNQCWLTLKDNFGASAEVVSMTAKFVLKGKTDKGYKYQIEEWRDEKGEWHATLKCDKSKRVYKFELSPTFVKWTITHY